MNRSKLLVCLCAVCGAVAGGCSQADNPPAMEQQPSAAKAPAQRTFGDAVPMTVFAANTADEVRPAGLPARCGSRPGEV